MIWAVATTPMRCLACEKGCRKAASMRLRPPEARPQRLGPNGGGAHFHANPPGLETEVTLYSSMCSKTGKTELEIGHIFGGRENMSWRD